MGHTVRNTDTNLFIWTRVNGFLIRLVVECNFFSVGFMSFKFVCNVTKQNLRRADFICWDSESNNNKNQSRVKPSLQCRRYKCELTL